MNHKSLSTAGANLPTRRPRRAGALEAGPTNAQGPASAAASLAERRSQRLARSARLGRDPELENVLGDVEGRLAELERLRSREYDDKLGVVEALAAPYALAFLHEIRRLDALFLQKSSRRATAEGAER